MLIVQRESCRQGPPPAKRHLPCHFRWTANTMPATSAALLPRARLHCSKHRSCAASAGAAYAMKLARAPLPATSGPPSEPCLERGSDTPQTQLQPPQGRIAATMSQPPTVCSPLTPADPTNSPSEAVLQAVLRSAGTSRFAARHATQAKMLRVQSRKAEDGVDIGDLPQSFHSSLSA